MAVETADRWKKGLAEWDLGPEQLKALGESADYAIYTPGSNSGIPVNILSSFQSPDIDWEANSEMLRERISSTVTALLGLIGMNLYRSTAVTRAYFALQPARDRLDQQAITHPDRPHSAGAESTHGSPGSFSDGFLLPGKESALTWRYCMNNFLASPSFQVWQQGQTLDIASILKSENGKPRHSIFYIAHLSENERMFFVTLLVCCG